MEAPTRKLRRARALLRLHDKHHLVILCFIAIFSRYNIRACLSLSIMLLAEVPQLSPLTGYVLFCCVAA